LASTGAVTVTTQGTAANVTIDNTTTDLSVQGTVNGALALTSGGTIANSGALTVSGTTAATTDVDDKSITLDQLASTGAVTVTTQGTAANVTIDNTTTDLSVGALQGNNVYLKSAGSVSSSSSSQINADALQVDAASGINVASKGIAHFAAESDSGDITIVNEGGYAISDLGSVAGFDFADKLSGVKFTNSAHNGKISLIAQSPLTINAPIVAGAGSVLLAAVGSASTDDITINSDITASSAVVYAGDSVELTTGNSIASSDTDINVASNYSPTTGATSTGSASGIFAYNSANDIPANLTVATNGKTTFRTNSEKSFVPVGNSSAAEELSNQFRGIFEEIQIWENISVVGFIPTVSELDNSVEPNNSGKTEFKRK